MKKIVKPKNFSTIDVWKFYKKRKKKAGEKVIPYWLFKTVIERYNKKISEAIIQGATVNLENHLGYIKIRKINRNFKKVTVNWGESNKKKAEIIAAGETPKDQDNPNGKNWLIHYTDPYYFRWAWIRKNGSSIFKNQTVYEFRPTSDPSKKGGEVDKKKLGNRGKLVLANKENPLLHFRYEEN